MVQAAESPLRDMLTVYSAVTATAGLGLSLYIALRDRAQVHALLDAGVSVAADGSMVPMVIVKAANRGRRVVVLNGCEFRLSNKMVLEFPQSAG
jgi:uncharacterized metal-binding protein